MLKKKNEEKDTHKNGFQQTIESQAEHCENWSRFLDELWFS